MKQVFALLFIIFFVGSLGVIYAKEPTIIKNDSGKKLRIILERNKQPLESQLVDADGSFTYLGKITGEEYLRVKNEVDSEILITDGPKKEGSYELSELMSLINVALRVEDIFNGL